MRFSLEDIDEEMRKRVATRDAVTALINSLFNRLDVHVESLGLNVGVNKIVIENQLLRGLAKVAPSIDGLLNEITDMVGVKLGVADVGVNKLSCGRPTIVG